MIPVLCPSRAFKKSTIVCYHAETCTQTPYDLVLLSITTPYNNGLIIRSSLHASEAK